MRINAGEQRNVPATKLAVAVITLFVVFLLAPSATAKNSNPGVLPPNSAPHGLTYGEWSARWFKWAYEPSPTQNPVLDTTGDNCATGQSGHVWFLAGTFGTGNPPVTRTCSIPSGRMLFFPVGNGFCAGDGFDFAGERACATQFAATLVNYAVEVDGVPIQGLGSNLFDSPYRALSPEWDLVLGQDNIFGAPAGTYTPGAGDGVYVMLAPLTPGEHLIHIHADFTTGGQIDATYHLTVGK